MITLFLNGATYQIKEELKADGFKWNPNKKAWYKNYGKNEPDYVKNLAEAFETTDGVWCEIVM